MLLHKITPRLNVHFTLSDMFTAIKGVFSKEVVDTGLTKYFPETEIYFTNHARIGLRLLLSSLDIPGKSRIGVIIYNCHTVFESITQAGYTPVFIDVTDDYKLNVSDLKRKVSQIDALIVTHLFGIPSDMNEIKIICGDKPIIEDCAHAFLNKYKDQPLGTFGIGSAFSFGHAKFPSAAEGGFVIINDANVNERFSQHHKKLKKESRPKQSISIMKALIFSTLMNRFIYGWITYPLKKKYGEKIDINNKYGFNERMCNPGFRFVFEKRLLRIIKTKNIQIKNSLAIINSLNSSIYISRKIIGQADFMVPVQTDKPVELIAHAFKDGMEFGQHFQNSIKWATEYGYVLGNCPTVETLIKKTVTIPCHYRLSDNDIDKIRNIVK